MTKNIFESFEKLVLDHGRFQREVYRAGNYNLETTYEIVKRSLLDFHANADSFKNQLERWAALPFLMALDQLVQPGWKDEMHVPPEYKAQEKQMIETIIADASNIYNFDRRRYMAHQLAKEVLKSGITPAYVWAEKRESVHGLIVTFYIVEK